MDDLISYFDMAGHGGFIWSSYGMVLIVLLGLWLISRRFVRTSQTELDGLNIKRPHRQTRQSNET